MTHLRDRARHRADELVRRLADLATGRPTTEDDIELAEQRLAEAREVLSEAYMQAAAAHERAAQAHEDAASRGVGDIDAHIAAAARHRAARAADLARASNGDTAPKGVTPGAA